MVETLEGTSITFDIRPYLQSRGWSIINNNKISHDSENSGVFEILSYAIESGGEYTISIEVETITDGTLTLEAGGAEVLNTSTQGYHQADFTANTSENIKLWSDGNVVISNINIQMKITEDYQEDPEQENTITWSELRKGWVTFKDVVPESGFSMYSNLFTLKEGNLWMHSELSTPNFIYGKQRYSTMKFPVSSVGVKTYHTIAVHANKVLGTTEDGIVTELGNVTDLITYDFDTSSDGIHYANKLRDALMNEKLKGRYIVVELSDEETKTEKLQLFKIIVKSEISSPNE